MPRCACCGKPERERPAVARRSLAGDARAQTELRLTELIERDGDGGEAGRGARGWKNNLPVVIVPGFCSSGLKVAHSVDKPEWRNERIWFSLQKLSSHKVGGKRRSTLSSTLPQLKVTLHSAANLPGLDPNGYSDPYVRVTLLSAEGEPLTQGTTGPQETNVQKTTRNPQWEEELFFGAADPLNTATAVDVLVLDKDRGVRDDVCGRVVIPLDESIHRMKRRRAADTPRANRSRRPSIAAGQLPRSLAINDESDPRVWLHDNEEFHLRSVATTSRSPQADGPDDSSAASPSASAESVGTIIVSIVYVPGQAGSVSDDSEESDEDPSIVEALKQRTVAAAREQASNLRQVGKTATSLAMQAAQHADIMQDAHVKELDKSAWLRHMLLDPDGMSDPEGIRVRNVDGIAGVDYLEDGHFVGRATTWVFAKVIEYLLKHGYEKDHNLRAAPYDWRVPPQILEKRDGYFSSLVKMIESTSERNGNKPVVLLGHSMGNKMAHYFLNWVVVNGSSGVPGSSLPEGNGRSWIGRYIHSFFPVAAPFLGASSACRAVVSGEDMGLSAFLALPQILTMSRNFGSAPWLLPTNQLAEPNPFHTLYLRNQCVVTIQLEHIEVEDPIGEAWIQILYKKTQQGKTRTEKVRTKLVKALPNSGGYVLSFEQRFQFIASKPLGQPMDDVITFILRGKSKGKTVKRAFQKKKLRDSSRTTTSAGLGSSTLSPELGQIQMSLADLFGTPDEYSVYRRSATIRRRPSLDNSGVYSDADIANVCRVQAVWRGHQLRKTQWLESQWKLHKGINDPVTEFWAAHHGPRALAYGWNNVVESAANALHTGLPVRVIVKDLKEHPQSFAGSEAVEYLRKWLHENSHPHQHGDATTLCSRLLGDGFIASCEDPPVLHFDPGYSLYSFTRILSPPNQRTGPVHRNDVEDEDDTHDYSDSDTSSTDSDHEPSGPADSPPFVTGFSMDANDFTDDDGGSPPPISSSKLARAQERARERKQQSELKSPPALPSRIPPRRQRQQAIKLHGDDDSDSDDSPPPVVQETQVLRPSSPGRKSILRGSSSNGTSQVSSRAQFSSSMNVYKTMSPNSESEFEPEPEPEPQSWMEVEQAVVSVKAKSPESKMDVITGGEFVSYKFAVLIDEEEVHTIEGRYSLLRKTYKDMPKLLLDCAAVFPGKHPEKGKNDASLVTLRQKELRLFFSALLLPSGYRRLPHPIRKLHRRMDIPEQVSSRLIQAEFGNAVELEFGDDVYDLDMDQPGGLPEGACDEGTIDVHKKFKLQVKNGTHVGELSAWCTFEFGNDELSQPLGRSSKYSYEARDPKQVLKRFGALNVVDKWETLYEPDPCLPGGTSYDPPPCERVFHVYGTNLQTEIAYAYERLHAVEVDIAGPKSCSIVLDNTLDKTFRDSNYVCKGGIIFETKDTDQSLVNSPAADHRAIVSGDGTCPYASMRHSLSWNGHEGMLSEVVELPDQEHREILASPVFHQTMCEYLCETLVVYVVSARNLPVMDFGGSSDPWCEVKLHFSNSGAVATRRTKTHYRNLNPDLEEIFTFGVQESLEFAAFLSFEVFDEDARGARNEHIGVVELPFSLINDESSARAVQGWFKLRNRPGYGKSKVTGSGQNESARMLDDDTDDPGSTAEIFLHCELENSGVSFRGIGEREAMERVIQYQRNHDRMQLRPYEP